MTGALEGHCMCSAVSVIATPTQPYITACNCDNCKRWTGGMNFAFEADANTVRIEGPVKTIALMPWAERGFCSKCGSGVFYRVTAEGPMKGLLKLSAGLFPDATGLPVGIEFYADERPAAFDLSQDHKTMTRAEVEALFSDNEETRP
jgi:hypothetical protein